MSLASESSNVAQAIAANLKRALKLRRILREERPDIAVAMMSTANVTLALAAVGLPVRTVGSERIYPPSLPLGRAWECLRRQLYPTLNALVAQTDKSALWLKHHAPAPTIKVIPNPVIYPLPVSGRQLSPTQYKRRIGALKLLVSIGRLHEQKAQDHLINAFARIAPRYTPWHLVILGEGPSRSALEKQVSELDINPRVHLPGTVGNVGQWLSEADLFALTSRFEGFPNALLEAMAYGLPVVSTDCDTGPSDFITPNVNGVLVPEHDPDALVLALEALMSDERRRDTLALKAQRVRETFSVKAIAKQWEHLFKQVLYP